MLARDPPVPRSPVAQMVGCRPVHWQCASGCRAGSGTVASGHPGHLQLTPLPRQGRPTGCPRRCRGRWQVLMTNSAAVRALVASRVKSKFTGSSSQSQRLRTSRSTSRASATRCLRRRRNCARRWPWSRLGRPALHLPHLRDKLTGVQSRVLRRPRRQFGLGSGQGRTFRPRWEGGRGDEQRLRGRAGTGPLHRGRRCPVPLRPGNRSDSRHQPRRPPPHRLRARGRARAWQPPTCSGSPGRAGCGVCSRPPTRPASSTRRRATSCERPATASGCRST